MTRTAPFRLAALLLAAALAAPGPAGAASRRPRAAATPDPRPDLALYREAQASLATLKATPARQAKRPEWEKVVLRFRRVVARYPQSGYCDNALLAVGDLYHAMAARFSIARYDEDAVQAYRSLVSQYPSSRLGEQALFAVLEIERAHGERKDVLAAGREYLDAFPDAPRAPGVKALLKKGARVPEAALPAPPPPGLAQVFDLRFWSGENSTRVVLDLEKAVRYKYDRIADPDRLWIDLDGTRLHPNLVGKSFLVGDGLLEKVRIGQNRDSVVRMVLDFKNVRDQTIFYLENPTRLVVDVRGTARPRMASATPSTPAPAPSAPEPFDLPPASPPPSAAPTPAPVRTDRLPARRVATLAPPAGVVLAAPPSPVPIVIDSLPRRTAAAAPPRPEVAPVPSPTPPAPIRAARRDPEPPLPPQANRAGSYSLARQLGLGARRIVIDAGHGGHDPGTIGHGGLQEKDLVLDVALRLERLVRTELGAEVVMTRSTDVFVPLEERTAIANAKEADLFLSIHANSSGNSGARGVETYFLNFAQDPHAEAVAARENAISAATLKDLQNLVKAIALNSKIDESREFATSVQESLVQNLRAGTPDLQNRGVRTAPFYVLIGANMPSVLAEIAFVSNPQEERLLRTGEHRERIAKSLFEGVHDYLESLSHTQTRQLTASPRRSTVASGGSRR